MSASVTVAQCFNRLAARGLVERNYGVRLVTKGVGKEGKSQEWMRVSHILADNRNHQMP
jgi:Mn-dependent DtxR family transcriptional regulator